MWNFQEVLLKDSQELVRTEVVFVRYGTRPGKDRSGAYLFLPDGEAQVSHLPLRTCREFTFVHRVKGSAIRDVIGGQMPNSQR